MSGRDGISEHLKEQLSGLGPITVRRMFGGRGVFLDGLMFAIIADDRLFLKADETTIPDFELEGLGPISYSKSDGKTVVMRYWQAPDRLLDDDDDMVAWARKAIEVARRAASTKPVKTRRGT